MMYICIVFKGIHRGLCPHSGSQVGENFGAMLDTVVVFDECSYDVESKDHELGPDEQIVFEGSFEACDEACDMLNDGQDIE